ncbi:MAG: ImmA/IrrE family metallo-endopeptidase [Terriglobia bacterium]
MRQKPDPVLLVSQSFLNRFGNDCGKRLPEVVREIGLEVVYCPAESYEGALLRIKGVPRGYVVVNSGIREESRQRFTLAHEVGHFLLPDQQELSSPCAKEKIENWNESLFRPEFDANQFAAEILMPRELVGTYLRTEPTIESTRSIAWQCGTSLTASAFRLAALTSFRAAVVWSKMGRVGWYKSSTEFIRWIRKGEVSNHTYAADCFKGKAVPDRLEPVPATAWLFDKGLREDARVWEQSVALPTYAAVLSLLVLREPVEAEDDSAPAEEELDPNEFTLNRTRWPSKR